MYKRVILAEKPDMGDSIARAIGIKNKKRGYIELTNGDVVTWAIGHLIHLKTPNKYPQYEKWSWDALPVIPEVMETEVDPKKIDQFNVVADLLKNSTECILATDPDREGEYIGRLILKQANYTKKFKRLWIDDLTESTILNGMANLQHSDDFNNLGDAAQVRSYADYWLGFTASRFFTLLAAQAPSSERVVLSAGRVQTPTLRLVFDREINMEDFKPKTFYQLQANFQAKAGNYMGQWFQTTSDVTINRCESKDEVDRLKSKISGQQGQVQRYTSKEVKRSAPQLLNSSQLKTASRKQLGFSTVRTTEILQSLYDKGYVSYPRADSRHLSENKATELASHLNKLREKSTYSSLFPDHIDSLVGKKRFVDDKKAATHHAIVPTGKNPSLATDTAKKITADEEKLYELILKHTLAAHYPEGLDRETEIVTIVADETFASRSVEVIVPGWRSLLKPEDDEQQPTADTFAVMTLPVVADADAVSVIGSELTTGKTSKPKRLNDDELEKLMENAGRFVSEDADEMVLEQVKERGIGTPATRTNIVQKLVTQEYIEIKKNLVYLSDKGRSFMQLVQDHPIASVELTGEFEKKLAEVEQGSSTASDVMNEFRQLAHDILKEKDRLLAKVSGIVASGQGFANVNEIGPCPKCGKPVIEHEKMYSCSGRRDGCYVSISKEFRSVQIKPKQAELLLTGKEILLKNIKAKEDKPAYDLYIKLNNGNIETRFPTAEDQSLGPCPSCGKPILEGAKGYGCSGWRSGCKFTIWKTYRKAEVTAKAAKSILAGKEAILSIEGEKAPYDLALYLDGTELKSKYPTVEVKSIGDCPVCKKPVVEGTYAYSCSGAKEGCKFKLPKEFLTQPIPVAQIKKLLKKGKTDKITGFKGGKNGTFDTALAYDPSSNRYAFVK